MNKEIKLSEVFKEQSKKESQYRASQHNNNQAEVGFNAKWMCRGSNWALDNITPKVAIAFRDWWMQLETLERAKLYSSIPEQDKSWEEFIKQYKPEV